MSVNEENELHVQVANGGYRAVAVDDETFAERLLNIFQILEISVSLVNGPKDIVEVDYFHEDHR